MKTIALLSIAIGLVADLAEPTQLKDNTLVVWVTSADLAQQGP